MAEILAVAQEALVQALDEDLSNMLGKLIMKDGYRAFDALVEIFGGPYPGEIKLLMFSRFVDATFKMAHMVEERKKGNA